MSPWKIIHLELSEGIPALSNESDCQGIYLVFWYQNIPLGHQLITLEQLPMPATQVTSLALKTITPVVKKRLSPEISLNFDSMLALKNPLAKFRDCLAKSAVKNETVSVIVCTRDRPLELAKCLNSLQNLSPPPEEIIVVDNAPSSDATRQLVAKMPKIKYVLESRPGLSVARNTGVRNSTKDIVMFTDDDVIIHPDWIVRLKRGFQTPEIMAVTGLVLPAELETESQQIFELEHGFFSGGYQQQIFDQKFFEKTKKIGVPVWDIGAGANMAFRKEVFDLVGYYDENLGPGILGGCGEDSEFWYRILANNWQCCYEPTAVVFHYHRKDLESLKKQMYQYMQGHVVALLVQFFRYKHWGNLLRLFILLPQYYLTLLATGLLKGFKLKHKTYLVEVLGCLVGIIKYFFQKFSLVVSLSTKN